MDTPRKVPSKEQWAALEKELTGFLGRARLRVDGFELMLEVQKLGPLKYCVVPFVNGHWRGKWFLKQEDGQYCEEARRFFPLRSVFLWKKKQRRMIARLMGKEEANKKSEWRVGRWTSIPALRRHLLANNHHIEILE